MFSVNTDAIFTGVLPAATSEELQKYSGDNLRGAERATGMMELWKTQKNQRVQ